MFAMARIEIKIIPNFFPIVYQDYNFSYFFNNEKLLIIDPINMITEPPSNKIRTVVLLINSNG
jgi:hypothetical protein